MTNEVVFERAAPSAAAEVSRYLREAISWGALVPGRPIDEVELASTLKVSRTPIREALRGLEAENLVEARRGVGFVVRQLSLDQITQLYEVRGLLEGEAARLAAQRISPADLWELEQQIARSEFLDGPTDHLPVHQIRQLTKANHGFHEGLARASGNIFLVRLIVQLATRPLVYRALYWYDRRGREESTAAHRAIVEALRLREPERARQLAAEHANQIASVLRNSLRVHPELLAEPDPGTAAPEEEVG